MKTLPLTPLSNRVFVKQDEAEKKKGSLIIADTAQVKPNTGSIVAVGKGFSDEFPMELKPGDRVLFEKNSGIEVIIDDEEYLIIRDVSAICVLHEKSTIVQMD